MKFADLIIGAVMAIGTMAPAAAATITGGNPVIDRTFYDGFRNFSILDGNNPISATGALTSWSIFSRDPALGGARLLIYRSNGTGYDLVRASGLETPASAGFQTFSLAPGFYVQGGDLLGLYFENFGATEYDLTPGGFMLYTANNSGFGNATNFVGSSERTYSLSVTGTVPEPATWTMLLVGFAGVGVGLRSRQSKAVAEA